MGAFDRPQIDPSHERLRPLPKDEDVKRDNVFKLIGKIALQWLKNRQREEGR